MARVKHGSLMLSLSSVKDVHLGQIYSESVLAKIVQVAQRGLQQEVRYSIYSLASAFVF
jgi:hypothetical protein